MKPSADAARGLVRKFIELGVDGLGPLAGAVKVADEHPGPLPVTSMGFRLIAKFGQEGAISCGKLVPLVGGPVGASVNVARCGRWARPPSAASWLAAAQ